MGERMTSRRAILAGLAAASTVPAGIGLANPGAGAVSDPLHAEAFRRLLIGYRWHQSARAISNTARSDSPEDAACTLVAHWLWDQAYAVLELSPPKTAVGMRATAFAMAIMYEGANAGDHPDREDARTARFVQSVVSFIGLPLPAEYIGFGDEPDYLERDDAMLARPGQLPAWALDGRSEPYPSDLMGGAQ